MTLCICGLLPIDPFEAEFLIEPPAELGVLADQPDSRRGFVDGRPQFVDVERLGEIGVRPVLHGGDGGVDRPVAGEHDDLGIGQFFLGFARESPGRRRRP